MTADDRSFIFHCKLDMNGLSGFIKTREHYLLLWGGDQQPPEDHLEQAGLVIGKRFNGDDL